MSAGGCRWGSGHGRILTLVAAGWVVGWGGRCAAAAAEPGPAKGPGRRAAEIAGLKTFLDEKEKALAQLMADYKTKLGDADALARDLEAQKEKADRSWFEQRTLERSTARLRVMYDDIEHLAARKQEVRTDAWSCAAAIVADLEDELAADLARLNANLAPAARDRLVEDVRALETDRRVYQRRMNELAPDLPAPAELPRGVTWTREMIEDQRRVYEATIARLQIERGDLVQQRELRRLLGSSLTLTGTDGADDGASRTRLDLKIAELDRRIAATREKLGRLAAANPSATGEPR